jgi:hypothetical protein
VEGFGLFVGAGEEWEFVSLGARMRYAHQG